MRNGFPRSHIQHPSPRVIGAGEDSAGRTASLGVRSHPSLSDVVKLSVEGSPTRGSPGMSGEGSPARGVLTEAGGGGGRVKPTGLKK